MRRAFILAAGLLVALAAVIFQIPLSEGGGNVLAVYRKGRALLPVYLPENAVPEEREAAEELARILGIMSGLATWPVQVETSTGPKGFYIGRTQLAAQAGHLLKPAGDILAPAAGECCPDTFRIWDNEGRVFLVGATPEATRFAVAWLLQHEAGVRWYLPGSIGEVIPQRKEWSLGHMDVTRKPAYVSREIHGANTHDGRWAWHNSLGGRLKYNHALNRVFPAEAYAEHPDWLPFIDGRRMLPPDTDSYSFQPNLALPEVAEYAAAKALQIFCVKPGLASFSLGMNDYVRFDEGPETQALVTPLRYFRRMPDYSPLLFTFMNRAAESLSRTRSDRYLGCLAYFWCESPPPFLVHPQVFPYVTTDRAQYYDKAYRLADFDLMSRWNASGAKTFGIWEYGYGRGFLIPRVPHHAFAEALREAWHSGARGYMCDMVPQWGFDGFKAWMLAQMLWEPDRSLDELADDFFSGCYGPAAEPMKRFFERCEQIWMKQDGPPWWIKFYQQEDQALLFPPETCRELRQLLEHARLIVEADPGTSARVELTSRAFAVTEAFVTFDEIRRRLEAFGPDAVETEALPSLLTELLDARTRLEAMHKESQSGELPAMARNSLGFFLRNDPVPRILHSLAQRDHEEARGMLAGLKNRTDVPPQWQIMAELSSTREAGRMRNLATNGNFEVSSPKGMQPSWLYPAWGEIPSGWQVHSVATENGKAALTSSDGISGRALRIEGAWDTRLPRHFRVREGCQYMVSIEIRGQSSPGGDAGLSISFLAEDGSLVGCQQTQMLPKGLTEQPMKLILCDKAPEGAAWLRVCIGALRQFGGDWCEFGEIEVWEEQPQASTDCTDNRRSSHTEARGSQKPDTNLCKSAFICG